MKPAAPAATIEALYAAFARLDADGMAACYAEGARFDDEAFSLKGRREIGGMWRMLVGAVKARGLADWVFTHGRVTGRTAHWEATYRFPATGRLVRNVIDAEFEFDGAGLILTHRDRFDFWRWSRQALGLPGLLLGWTPWLRARVRSQAAINLQRFLDKAPA